MAASASPYGLRPTNMQGGQPMSHGMRLYKIASGYGTSIFQGDLVKLVVGGTIEKDTGTTTALPVGVFMGVEYVDPTTKQLWHRNMWTASTSVPSGTTAWAYVFDDPDALFEVQSDETLGQNAIGTNAALVQGSGSAATGNSGVSLDGSSIANSATLPLRIVDYVRRPGSVLGDAYTDVIVRINTHFNRSATGNAKT